MARTVATNFTGGLQFPYATAAADIFKKEDVQTLALAVDQHTHGTGLGAAVAIADGSVTLAKLAANSVDSSKIVDGSITTADIATNAVSLYHVAAGISPTPSTTSASPVDIPDCVLTFTTTVVCDLYLWVEGTFYVSGATPTDPFYGIQLVLDGSILNAGRADLTQTQANNRRDIIYVFGNQSAVAAGAHTMSARWYVQGGLSATLSSLGTGRMFGALELRR